MACFLVSAAEAAVVTACAKAVEKKEQSAEGAEAGIREHTTSHAAHIPFSRKLKWLSTMLWGGSALLALEHLWHGEIVPWFPFLTAMGDPKSASEMFREMATVGVGMAVLVTAIWLVMVGVSVLIEKKALSKEPQSLLSEE